MSLYTHASYRVTREDGTLIIWDGPYRLPDAPCTLTEAIAFIADYCECDICEGVGTTPCRTCKGEGYFLLSTNSGNGKSRISCPDCRGRGWTTCRRCGGSGEKP